MRGGEMEMRAKESRRKCSKNGPETTPAEANNYGTSTNRLTSEMACTDSSVAPSQYKKQKAGGKP